MENLLKSYYEAREKFNLIYHKHYVIELFENYGKGYFDIILHDLISEKYIIMKIPFIKIKEKSTEEVLEAYNLLIKELPYE